MRSGDRQGKDPEGTPESAGDAAQDAPSVTVTLVLYNSAGQLEDCLRSIRAEVENGFAELVAVDNASPDTSAEIVSELMPAARIVRSDHNRGFAGGVNLAWPYVAARYWMLLNPDVVVPTRGLQALVAWMDAHPEIGFASPELESPDGGSGTPGRALPSLALTLLELSRLHLLLPAATRGGLLRGAYWPGGDQLDAGWVPGTALIVRREAVEDVGLLSEAFFMYGEDIDWCWRANSAGWGVGVCSSVSFRHLEGSSASQTWDAHEAARRMANGLYDSVRRARGERYARLYLRANAFALRLEAAHPGRERVVRERSRAGWAAYQAVLTERAR